MAVGSGSRGGFTLYRCSCPAQTVKELETWRVRNNYVRSCGCLRTEVQATINRTHGASSGGKSSAEYRLWCSMKERCHRKEHVSYAYYGGRGVTVCQRWRDSFEDFLADVGPHPGKPYTLDRIDNARGYEPGNVRWLTRAEQMRNTRRVIWLEHAGVRWALGEWMRYLGVSRDTIHRRIGKYGRDAVIAELLTEKGLVAPTPDTVPPANPRAKKCP
jgi:hypothetical protein